MRLRRVRERAHPHAGRGPRIGDQFNFETIQSVAYRLAAYYDVPQAFPLGRFYETTTPGGARIVTSPLHEHLAQFRFAEVTGPTSRAPSSRIPRLTKAWLVRSLGFLFFGVAVGLYPVITRPESRASTGLLFEKLGFDPTIGTMLAAGAVVVLCAWLARVFAFWGVRLLLLVGGGVVASMVAYHLYYGAGDTAIWPVLIAGAIFFYLWWLAALLFDLVFVWHRYIRHSAAVNDLRDMRAASQTRPGSDVRPAAG